jgi:ribonucleoside-diphosphate reductase beta chain
MPKLLDQRVDSGVSQLISSPNQWAIELWKRGVANNWTAHETDMSTDIKQWRGDVLNDAEKLLVKRVLGLFSAGESLVSNSIFTVERKYVTDGCCRQYMGRKDYEEQNHNMTVAVCCESFGLDPDEVAEAYKSIPAVKKKTQYLKRVLDSFDADFNISTLEGKRLFVKNLIVVYLLMEGCWFFTSFALLMGLGRQNKLPGLYDQIVYTQKDEVNHVEFGVKLINQIKEEYSDVFNSSFIEQVKDIFKQGVELEIEYAQDVLPEGIVGITSNMTIDYIKYLANLRLSQIDIDAVFEDTKNPFTWLAEAQEASGMSAFFERREKSYQNAAALEDDF